MNRTILNTGDKYGKLTIINESDVPKGKGVFYNVKCDCGNIRSYAARAIKNGKVETCGKGKCLDRKEWEDHTGKTIGMLCVKSFNAENKKYTGECSNCKTQILIDRSNLQVYFLKNSYQHSCKGVRPKNLINEKSQPKGDKNIIGTFIGELKILNDEIKDNIFIYTCQCSCGKIVKRSYESIINVKSNGFIARCDKNCPKKLKEMISYKYKIGEIPLFYINGIKSNCLKRKMEFNLSGEYMDELFKKQNGKCALSGIEIGFDFYTKKENRNVTASLDRINSSKGYEEGNVQWIHKDVNFMKSDLDSNSFLNYCSIIAKNHASL